MPCAPCKGRPDGEMCGRLNHPGSPANRAASLPSSSVAHWPPFSRVRHWTSVAPTENVLCDGVSERSQVQNGLPGPFSSLTHVHIVPSVRAHVLVQDTNNHKTHTSPHVSDGGMISCFNAYALTSCQYTVSSDFNCECSSKIQLHHSRAALLPLCSPFSLA